MQPIDERIPLGTDLTTNDKALASLLRSLHQVLSKASLERNLLRLSTCRNHYMVINALYLDVAECLARGSKSSSIPARCGAIRNGHIKDSVRIGGAITMYMDHFQLKREVWNQWRPLKNAFDAEVAKLKADDQDEVQACLDQVRSAWPTGVSCNPCYLELSPDVKAELVVAEKTLADTVDQFAGIQRLLDSLQAAKEHDQAVVKAQRRAASQATLVDLVPAADPWRLFLDVLQREEQLLGLSVVVNGAAAAVLSPSLESPYALPTQPPSLDAAVSTALSMVEGICAGIERRLIGVFPPNVGRRPLPDPYVIDLTSKQDMGSSSGPVERPSVRVLPVTIGPCHIESGAPLLALLECGVDVARYCVERTYIYKSTERPDVLSKLLGVMARALELAKSKGAVALLGPEFFLPRELVTTVEAEARRLGLGLVVGLEADTTTGFLVNEALIVWPESPSVFKQQKILPSVYEPQLAKFKAGDRVEVYGNTALGNVAVAICSDHLEPAVWGEIYRRTPDLDLLLVPCLNPNPHIFELHARADANRFNCAVAGANSWFQADEDGRPPIVKPGVFFATPAKEQPTLDRFRIEGAMGLSPESPCIHLAPVPLALLGARNRTSRTSSAWPVPLSRRVGN